MDHYATLMGFPRTKKRLAVVSTPAKSRRRSENVVKHSTSSRPISIYPRNPTLRSGYQSTHLPGINQRQRAQIQFFQRSAAQVSVAASTFSVPLKIQMNGAYDPDSTFSASQPATFAKYMAWYSKCVVTAARVKITVNNQPGTNGNNAQTPFTWGITLLTNNTAPANIQEAITGGTRTYTMQYSAPDVKTLTQKVDIAKFLGVNDLENNPDYACTSSANPAQLVVSQFWVDNNTGAALLFQYIVEVVYDVVFYDPIIVT